MSNAMLMIDTGTPEQRTRTLPISGLAEAASA